MLSKVIRGEPARGFAPLELRALPGDTAANAAAVWRQNAPETSGAEARIAALEASLEAAKRAAFEEGLKRGREESGVEGAPIIDQLNRSITEIVSLKPNLRRKAEADAV